MPIISISQEDLDDTLQELSDLHDSIDDSEWRDKLDRLCGSLRNEQPATVVVDITGNTINKVTANVPVEVIFCDEDNDSVSSEFDGTTDAQVMPCTFAEGEDDDADNACAYGRHDASVEPKTIAHMYAYLGDEQRQIKFTTAVESI